MVKFFGGTSDVSHYIPGFSIAAENYDADGFEKNYQADYGINWNHYHEYVAGPQYIWQSVNINIGQGNSANQGGFDNSKTALDIGGGIYGAMEGLTSSRGYWVGKNGNYYSNSWGGNQYTGSRSGAFKAANQYKLAGKAAIGVSVVIGVAETFNSYQMDGGKFGYKAQSAAVQTIGSLAGGWAGAEAGASIGAGIGVWFGGVGAVPGAVIGGVVGGFFGGYYGGQAGGNFGQGVVNYYHGR